jgi:hypothetical protein
MKCICAALAFGVLLGPVVGSVWSQHEGHGGMEMPNSPPVSREETHRARTEKLTSLQEKIDALEKQLENPNLTEKKRAKLKKRVDKLYKKKDELQAEGSAERRAVKETCSGDEPCKETTEAVYVCPMGDYTGPKTKDGSCPKCGMSLQKRGGKP